MAYRRVVCQQQEAEVLFLTAHRARRAHRAHRAAAAAARVCKYL